MRNGIFRHIRLLGLLLFLFAACQEKEQISKGKGRLILGDVEVSIEAETRAFSLPELNKSNITIDVIDPLGDIIETGNIDHYKNGIELFAATYTIKAHYGTKVQMGTTPYYEGVVNIALAENETKSITIPVSLANAIIIPNIPQDLSSHYNSAPTFHVAYNEEEVFVANGEALYVLPGDSPYILTLKGQNKANVDVVKNIGNLNVEAKKVYNINCSTTLPILTLPEQQDGAWAKRLYLTSVTATDAANNPIAIPQGIIYEMQENNKSTESDSDNWSEWKTVTIKDTLVADVSLSLKMIKNLSPNKEYKLRAGLANTIYSNVISFKTENVSNVPNAGMEEWSYTDGPKNWAGGPYWKKWYVRETQNESNEGWCTLNGLTTNVDSRLAYCANSGTERTDDKVSGSYAAEIKTIGWGSGNTAAGGASSIKNITPGELFLGAVNDVTNPNYYYTFDTRPNKISFYCKYECKGTRQYSVTCQLYDNNKNIIAEGYLSEGAVTNYTPKTVTLIYKNYRAKAQYITLKFSSGENSHGELDKGSVSNSARHTGNKLYIDDISLIYE